MTRGKTLCPEWIEVRVRSRVYFDSIVFLHKVFWSLFLGMKFVSLWDVDTIFETDDLRSRNPSIIFSN